MRFSIALTGWIWVGALGCDDAAGPAAQNDAARPDAAASPAALDAAPSTVDAAPADARAPDGTLPERDAAPPSPDAVPLDAAPCARAPCDAGPSDAGSPDAGSSDAGSPDANPAAPRPLACPDRDFAACGGNLVGVWSLVDFCGPAGLAGAPRTCEGPGEDVPACQGGVNRRLCSIRYRGTVELTADGEVNARFSVGAAVEYGFDDACLAAFVRGSDARDRCTSLASDRIDCAYANGECVCRGQTDPEGGPFQRAYAVDGAAVTIGAAPGRYCVDGDRLTIAFDPRGPEGWIAWILSR